MNVSLDQRLIEIGEKIRQYRLEKNISQEDLAKLAHINRSYLGRIERGELNITVQKLYQISDALNLPANLLI